MRMYLAKLVTIDGHMVIIPAKEYELLLREAGHKSAPKLDKRITDARSRYRKKKYLSWNKVK